MSGFFLSFFLFLFLPHKKLLLLLRSLPFFLIKWEVFDLACVRSTPPPLAPSLTSRSSRLCLLSSAEAPGQDFVTLDYRLRYYPSITYAVIGSAVVFVLVVAMLALVLHHQRKRGVLLPRGVRGSLHPRRHHQPLLLSRLVILDQGGLHPDAAAGQYRSNALQLLSGALYPSGLSTDSLPSYSQAVHDAR